MRIWIGLLCMNALFELISYYCFKTQLYNLRNAMYHFSTIIELILYTVYFITLLQPYRYDAFFKISIVIWPLIGALNIYFFEPLTWINTNMLMLQSFSLITMSLYVIYRMLKNTTGNIFHSSHFWVCVLWLISSSYTFFFWAFLKVLYKHHWEYMELILQLQIIMLIGIYTGVTIILFTYTKNQKNLEYI